MGENRRREAFLPEGLSVAEVRLHLEQILSSAEFANAERMSRFLRFAFDETLAGRGPELKEYAIGVAVFDRPESFDPRTDPIVRVEARRVRAKLDACYAKQGVAGSLRLDLPKGGYALVVRRVAKSPEPERRDETGLADVIRLAVLPFSNLSPEGQRDYFSEGLAEELIHLLTKIPALELIAWRSSARLLGENDSPGHAYQRLNVDFVLRGNVRRGRNQVRVSVQLIEARSDRYVWSEIYERGIDDVLAIENEIATAIALQLRVELSPRGAGSTAQNATSPGIGSEEHTLYLKGRFHARKRTVEGLERSIQCYEQAIAIRPSYALAHAAIADSLSLVTIYGVRYPAETVPLARGAAERALAGDSVAQAAAYASLGLITAMHDHRWIEAERLFRNAIRLEPSYAEAHHWLAANLLGPLGRFDEAREILAVAQRLDPLNAVIAESRGFMRMLARQYDEALAAYRAAMELDPNFHLTNSSIGRLYMLQGNYEEAVAWMTKARELSGGSDKLDAALGQCLWLAGRREEALRTLQRLKTKAKSQFVPYTAVAVLLLGMDQHEAAIDWLEQALKRGEFSASYIGVHPLYDPLRRHPAFHRLVQTLDLTPPVTP